MRNTAAGGKSATSAEFFDAHPVFTRVEFQTEGGRRTLRTTDSLLRRYAADGRLLRVRAGLYAVVPRGTDAGAASVDPYLVATKLAADATVAYHAALQFWGKAYSVLKRFHYLTSTSTRAFTFRGLEFVPVRTSRAARGLPAGEMQITHQRHAGGVARVTTLERTMVDVLDAPGYAGGWEEIWRSLEMVEFFDLDAVISYTEKLERALTAARVGFFLEQHRDALMVESRHLERLKRQRPRQPRYFDARRKTGKLSPGWNVIVPEEVLGRTWAAVP